MEKLIPFGQKFVAGKSVRTVSGRDLHRFLGVGRDFSNWMKGRIHQYRFTSQADYLKVYAKTGVNSGHGRNEVNYHLTMDMAKELAMVERTDKGREARRYFLDCERELHERKAAALPAPVQAPQLAAQALMPSRILVVVENGQVVSRTDVSDCDVVNSEALRKVNRNLQIMSQQLAWLAGEGPLASLDMEIEPVG